MCGIVGIISSKEVTGRIINSLKKLEYRGYDSAGIGTQVDGNIDEGKCEGRGEVLEKDMTKFNHEGEIGMENVRGGTNGKQSKIKAHHHTADEQSVVENWISQN